MQEKRGIGVNHHFQVNLRGVIELLSDHLYSGPEVFVRELLQNAVDAIRAREKLEQDFQGEIELELSKGRSGEPPTLLISENGVGLTEDEIHRFLATIGESSKRGLNGERPVDFVGQFGIGLLSCFMVSDEIVVVTRSAKSGHAAMEWRGRCDGTYSVKSIDADLAPGTQVYLKCKPGAEEYFERDRLVELAGYFGSLLPYPVRVKAGRAVKCVNAEPPPWRRSFASASQRTKALLHYGQEVFGERFFDAVPLDLAAEGVDGVAYILNASPNATLKENHRIYLKSMFLNEKAGDLAPPWAFFVKFVLNSTKLRPNAAREGLQEDAIFEATRDAIGRKLRNYLIVLSEREPEKLTKLIALHDLTIRALAVDDDEFYRIVFDWLPVETTQGDMTLGEYRARFDILRYAPSMDQFRQIAQVAAAQKICVINASYVYMLPLIEKYPSVFESGEIERIEAGDIVDQFNELDDDEDDQAEAFTRQANAILKPFRCRAEVKKFAPADLPTIFTTSTEADFFRAVERSQEVADPHWSSVLGSIAPGSMLHSYVSQLCFNYENPMVRGLMGIGNPEILRNSVQMLYVQSLLLGHHPLNSGELKLLGEGLLKLIEMAVKNAGGSQK